MEQIYNNLLYNIVCIIGQGPEISSLGTAEDENIIKIVKPTRKSSVNSLQNTISYVKFYI